MSIFLSLMLTAFFALSTGSPDVESPFLADFSLMHPAAGDFFNPEPISFLHSKTIMAMKVFVSGDPRLPQMELASSSDIPFPGATGYLIDSCPGFASFVFPAGVCLNNIGSNIAFSFTTTNTTVIRITMLYNASDYSCTGPILRNFTSNFPTTCASVSATQPAGRLTTYSFGDVLPFHDGCARPTDQVGFVDGQCYRSRYPQSFVFRSCDQSGEYGYIEGYFATSNCTGPSVFITLIFGPTPPTCNIFPSNQNYSTQCFPSLIAPPAVAPLPKGNAVLCYQASLTEYVIDFKAFSSALASGTGTATIVAFVATGELKLDVAFTGLSSPTDDLGISFEVPSPISKDNIKFTNGIPFNVTSGVYSNTTSIAGNVLQDLVAEVEGGARITVSTVLGFLYGEFSRLEPGSDQHIAHCQARPEPKNLRAVAF